MIKHNMWRDPEYCYVPDEIAEYIDSKYNVLEYHDLSQLADSWDTFDKLLQSYTSRSFQQNDLFVITHTDTDYYDFNLMKCGVSIGNLIKCFNNRFIPLDKLLLYTTHPNIIDEIKLISKSSVLRPKIFTALQDRQMFEEFDTVPNFEFSVDSISKHAICMMGNERSHRNAVRNEIYKQNLRDKTVLSYRSFALEVLGGRHDMDPDGTIHQNQ